MATARVDPVRIRQLAYAYGTGLLPPQKYSRSPGRSSLPPERSSSPPDVSSPPASGLVPDLLPPCLRILLSTPSVPELPVVSRPAHQGKKWQGKKGLSEEAHTYDDVREEQVARDAEKMKSLGIAVISSDLNELKKAAI